MFVKRLLMGVNTIRLMKMGVLSMVVIALSACSSGEETESIGNWKFQKSQISGTGRAYAVGVSIDTNDDGMEDTAYYGLGWDNTGGSQSRMKDWWRFDPASGEHTKMANFPGEARQEAVAFTVKGRVYVGTGKDQNNWFLDFWEYDPSGNSWTQTDSLPVNANKEEGELRELGRYGAVAFSIGNIGYVGTGLSRSFDVDHVPSDVYNNDFYRFDPDAAAGAKWTQIVGGGTKRRGAVAFVIDGEAYLCTGYNGSNLTDFFKFTPSGNGGTWTDLRNINSYHPYEDFDNLYTDIVRSNGAAWAANGRGYLATGSNSSTWEYNPVSDLWRRKTDLEINAGRMGALAFYLNGWGYLMTGTNGSTYFSDVWLFQPNAEIDKSDNQ